MAGFQDATCNLRPENRYPALFARGMMESVRSADPGLEAAFVFANEPAAWR